ncbi:hypothetical protein [Engelhardtia mirabilis]|uniref:HK97 gp10 family phage protein n=1 Tax=Engelhardtia mirabilis TaxID=2528011 RepID=A0A518BL60_9BACT|nr:hypothetical protein Pla133_27970 [Planctomycetes bacterium Pla133]QDV02035.1 hypothetical protein Pla86_27960 [Planctomycetes bacterium Pla86]
MALRGVKAFNQKIRRAARAMSEEIAPLFVAKLGLELTRGAVLSTPVRARQVDPRSGKPRKNQVAGGTLRGSWNLDIGRASDRVHPKDPTGASAVQRATAVAASLRRVVPRLVVSTPVAYAPVIEAGRRRGDDGVMRGSIQAPRGMLRINVRRLSKSIAPLSVTSEVEAKAKAAGFDS